MLSGSCLLSFGVILRQTTEGAGFFDPGLLAYHASFLPHTRHRVSRTALPSPLSKGWKLLVMDDYSVFANCFMRNYLLYDYLEC